MSDASELLEPLDDAPTPEEQRRTRARVQTHISYLILYITVLLLAMLMTRSGESRVDIPFTNIPLPTLCTMKSWSGLDCPGCGLTRCFISLAHGDVAAAWHFNPAGILLFAALVIQIPYRSLQLWRLRRGLPEFNVRHAGYVLTSVLISALILQWIGKLIATSL